MPLVAIRKPCLKVKPIVNTAACHHHSYRTSTGSFEVKWLTLYHTFEKSPTVKVKDKTKKHQPNNKNNLIRKKIGRNRDIAKKN